MRHLLNIDHDYPSVPKMIKRRPAFAFKRSLELMNVGDSVLITDRKVGDLSSNVCRIGRKTKMDFTLRTEGNNVRIWRIK